MHPLFHTQLTWMLLVPNLCSIKDVELCEKRQVLFFLHHLSSGSDRCRIETWQTIVQWTEASSWCKQCEVRRQRKWEGGVYFPQLPLTHEKHFHPWKGFIHYNQRFQGLRWPSLFCQLSPEVWWLVCLGSGHIHITEVLGNVIVCHIYILESTFIQTSSPIFLRSEHPQR